MRRAPLLLLLVVFAVPAIARTGSAQSLGAGSLGAPLWQRADHATRERVQDWVDRSSSGWSPNRGQVPGGGGRASTDVLFSTKGNQARVYLTTRGLSYWFLAREAEAEHEPGGERHEKPRTIEWSRVDLTLEGATIRPASARPRRPIAERGVENFYLPHCPEGVLGVPAYAEVEFAEVYPGIDWIVRGEPGNPAHQDFVVRPGADPTQIRFTYEGANSVEIANDGQSILVRTALGEVREGALKCTQAGGSRVVGARFVRDGEAITVQVDDYVRTEPLVIDPPMVWSTYYGGEDYDGTLTIYTDNVNQAVYAVGYTASDSLPMFLGGGYNQGSYGGGVDGAIWKFSQLGVRQWVTYYGGSNYDGCQDATLDGLGNLYVCGETGSNDLPVMILGGAYNQLTGLGGFTDGFLLKFDGLGALQWGTHFGGSADEAANGITTDAAGKIYLCGQTQSIDLPLANPGGGAYYDNSFNLGEDCWVARFSTLGALEWSTYFGGGNLENALGVAAGGGNLYVTGYTWSSDFPTLDPSGGAYFQPALNAQQDAFITRFTLPGALTWSTYFGGDDWDSADQPIVNAGGRVVVSGHTRSTDLPTWNPGGGAYYVNAPVGQWDLFFAEFTASAVPVWGTYFGGTGEDLCERAVAKSMALDSFGRLYYTARTTSSDFPVVTPVGSYVDNSWAGSTDAVIARFGANRALEWSTYFGAADTDFGTSVAVGIGDCLFATGEAWGAGMATSDPGLSAYYDPSNNGVDDVYFTKFCAPNSTCCLDNNCLPATSQAQCFAMGGTAFYAGQPCSTVVCTILCTICGTKYNDLNRNGVKDPGEPGLAGWTIELRYPNGPVYAAMVTGVNGEYCFSGIPCGGWEVGELHQPGWVQTWPTTAVHAVTLGTGTTQNGVDFGNYNCGSAPPCIPSPKWLAAWWPFSDYPGALSATDVAHPDSPRNRLQLQGGAALDSALLCLSGPTDFASAADADQLGLDFDSGSFSIAAWVHVEAGVAGTRTIVEKRALVSPGVSRGWSLSLDGLQSMLELGTGSGATQVVPGPDVTPDEWAHVAVALDRASGQGRWYLNGTPAPAFNFTPVAGNVTSDADLLVGQRNPAFGPGAGFEGCVADLSLYGAAISATDAQKAWMPGPISFCPEYAAIPAVTTFCQGQTSRQVCFTICNNNATAQTYQWSLAGLAAGPGCNTAGPTQISPASGTVVVPAGGCSPPICVTIQRPTGFTAHNAMSCFSLTFINTQTGRCQTRTSKLRVDNSCWCATPPPSVVSVAARVPGGTLIGIPIGLPCDPVAILAYQVRAEWLDSEHADPVALSLNGLPPGMPVTGELDASSGVAPTLDVVARYPNGHDPSALYEIVVEADTDGDGSPERLGGTVVRSTYEAVQNTGVPAGVATGIAAGLRASPNPFFAHSTIELGLPRAESIDLAVYDLGGRLVRSLARGRFEAGPRTFVWDGHGADGRRAPAGIYFVRCVGGGRSMEAKLVKLR